jgi:tetratricopeptide (TPR) repeat protein
MAVDLAALWDFNRPDLSEQRLRAELKHARGDDALILQTQIARSFGLRGEFDRARAHLRSIEPQLIAAGAEPRVRQALELGRSFVSAAHPAAAISAADRAQARTHYLRALALARQAQLDGLAVDAMHMMPFVETAPDEQMRWNLEALALAEASTQADARRWEASLRNNIGYALSEQGRTEEALAQFERAVVLRERGTDAAALRVAHWMVARTLRTLDRADEALATQLQLERESDAAGAPDPYVFEELEVLYRARGDVQRAEHYAARRNVLATKPES